MDITFDDILDISGVMDDIMSDEPTEQEQDSENTQSHNETTDSP